jgi:NAD(P)-dependent dehydrogenase (short-subunit alcohol dehydrogenase family)
VACAASRLSALIPDSIARRKSVCRMANIPA